MAITRRVYIAYLFHCTWLYLVLHVETQQVPAEIEPDAIGGVFKPATNIYGNAASLRPNYVSTGGQQTYVDINHELPTGLLNRLYVFAHNFPVRPDIPKDVYIRLEVWRPSSGGNRMTLLWQRRTHLNTTFGDGALYEFDLQEEPVSVEEGDRLGFTSENEMVPVSQDRGTGGRVQTRPYSNIGDIPAQGSVYLFDGAILNAVFSVAARVTFQQIFSCSFDTATSCPQLVRDASVETEWTFGQKATPSIGTGPTTGEGGAGGYLFLESSDPVQIGHRARITTPALNTLGNVCIRFYYYLYGDHFGQLNLYTQVGDDFDETRRYLHNFQQISLETWVRYAITVELESTSSKVGWEAIRGIDYRSDVAIDSILITNSSCDGDGQTVPSSSPITPTPAVTTTPTTTPTTTSTTSTPSTTTASTTSSTTTRTTPITTPITTRITATTPTNTPRLNTSTAAPPEPIRVHPAVTIVRRDKNQRVWCTLYEALAINDNVEFTWYYPDGTRVAENSIQEDDPNVDVRTQVTNMYSLDEEYHVSSLFLLTTDPSFSGHYTCEASYSGRVSQATAHIIVAGCGRRHFECGTGDCVPKNWVCDGANDCADWSDESTC